MTVGSLTGDKPVRAEAKLFCYIPAQAAPILLSRGINHGRHRIWLLMDGEGILDAVLSASPCSWIGTLS